MTVSYQFVFLLGCHEIAQRLAATTI